MSMFSFPPPTQTASLMTTPFWSPDFRSWISWKSSWITTPLPKKNGFKRGFIWPFRHLVHRTSESSIFIGASQSLLSSKVMTPKAKRWEILPGNCIFWQANNSTWISGHVDGMCLDLSWMQSQLLQNQSIQIFWISWWASEKEEISGFLLFVSQFVMILVPSNLWSLELPFWIDHVYQRCGLQTAAPNSLGINPATSAIFIQLAGEGLQLQVSAKDLKTAPAAPPASRSRLWFMKKNMGQIGEYHWNKWDFSQTSTNSLLHMGVS